MGIVINHQKVSNYLSFDRLKIYSGRSALFSSEAVSINKFIASKLIEIKPNQRTIQLEKCFMKVLNGLPDQPVIKDIDVLFNPAYKVDVMKMLASAYKQKKFSLVWPGTYADGKLIYSEEGYPDYRVYEIKDYDIMYVI